MNIGDRLALTRRKLEMTQQELGEKIGMPSTQISFFETGRRNPAIHNLISLAKGLGVTTDYLLGIKEGEGAS